MGGDAGGARQAFECTYRATQLPSATQQLCKPALASEQTRLATPCGRTIRGLLWRYCPLCAKTFAKRLVNRTRMSHQIAEDKTGRSARRREWPAFSWLSLTSGLFDRLKINFLSSVQVRQGHNTSRRFLRTPLDTERQFRDVGNGEAIAARKLDFPPHRPSNGNRIIRRSLF